MSTFYSHGLIPTVDSNYIHCKVWDEITYSFPNFNGATIEVCQWISYSIPHFTRHVITHRSLQWRHNVQDSVSNHQPHDCLLNHLFRRRSKKTSKLRVTGLCVGNSPGTGEFPAQMASNAENVSIWWRLMCYKGPSMSYHFIQIWTAGSGKNHGSSWKFIPAPPNMLP